MRIAIDNRQRKFFICRAALRQVVAGLAAQAAASRGARPWRELTVILTDDAGITPLNLRVMRHAGSTDVISQRYESLPGEPDGMRGELLVNVERAWQVAARRRNWPASRELALYIAHGCDHLNDAEDATPAGRRRMRRRELRWLARLCVPDFACREIRGVMGWRQGAAVPREVQRKDGGACLTMSGHRRQGRRS